MSHWLEQERVTCASAGEPGRGLEKRKRLVSLVNHSAITLIHAKPRAPTENVSVNTSNNKSEQRKVSVRRLGVDNTSTSGLHTDGNTRIPVVVSHLVSFGCVQREDGMWSS